MHPLSEFFRESDKRYLTAAELKTLGRYTLSLPHRLAIYRQIRDQELDLLQPVADGLESAMAGMSVTAIEQSLKLGIAVMRASAMAMLTNDIASLDDTLRWVSQSQSNHGSQQMDELCFQLVAQQLEQRLEAAHFKLFLPYLEPFQKLATVAA